MNPTSSYCKADALTTQPPRLCGSLVHLDEELLSILYELHNEFKLKCLKDLKEISFGSLTDGIASNSGVLKFVEYLGIKPVKTLKLKITILN